MEPLAKRPRTETRPVDANGKPLNRKRFLKFLKSHELKFALEPVARDEASGEVTLAVCRFCQHFGREQRPDKKRRSTKNVKFFRNSFRTDQYQQHHELSHTERWAQYQQCSDEEKHAFFPQSDRAMAAVVMQQETQLRAPVELKSGEVWAVQPTAAEKERSFEIAPAIVELVAVLAIGATEPTVENTNEKINHRVLSHAHEPNCSEAVAGWNPPQGTFESCLLVGTVVEPVFRVIAYSRAQIDCLVELAAAGLSFRQISSTIRSFRTYSPVISRDLTKDNNLVGNEPISDKVSQRDQHCSPKYDEEQAAEFVRLIVGVSMNVTARLLRESWAFSLEIRACMQHAPIRSYLEFRVKVYGGGAMQNLHVLTIPGFENKCKMMMFETLDRVLRAMLPNWRLRLLGVAIDGDAQMPAQVLYIVTRLQGEALNNIMYRSTSGCHQLDKILNNFYSSLQGGCFLLTLTDLLAYVRRQSELLARMGGEIPSLPSYGGAFTSKQKWIALGNQTNWVAAHRDVICEHLEADMPSNAPDSSWWLFLAAVDWVASRANETFEKMLRKNATTSDQVEALAALAKECAAAFNVQKPVGEPLLALKSPPSVKMFCSRKGRFALSKPSMLAFIREVSPPSVRIMEVMEEPLVDLFAENVAMCGVNMVESLHDLSVTLGKELSLGDAGNLKVTEFLPPTLPSELAQLSEPEFSSLLQTYSQSLRNFLGREKNIDVIYQDLQSLRQEVFTDSVLRSELAKCTNDMSFEEAWAPTKHRFRHLECFAGGFASVFTCDPISTCGETTDLPLCRSDMDTAKVLLTDFALEGTLHAQQFSALISLNEKVDVESKE